MEKTQLQIDRERDIAYMKAECCQIPIISAAMKSCAAGIHMFDTIALKKREAERKALQGRPDPKIY